MFAGLSPKGVFALQLHHLSILVFSHVWEWYALITLYHILQSKSKIYPFVFFWLSAVGLNTPVLTALKHWLNVQENGRNPNQK